jgi:hypothetical protein
MNRRTFIRISAGALVIAAVSIYLLGFKRTIRSMLRSDTEGLQLEAGAIDKFLEEAQKEKYLIKFGFVKQVLIGGQHILYEMGLRLPYHEKYVQYRNMITGHFLMSTDFFMNRMDVKKPVTYLGFYNPYKAPCSVPFSNLLYPS